MPDDNAVPDDLVDLQLAARAAQRAAEAFSAAIAAQARVKFPDPDQWLERLCWPASPPEGGLTKDGPATSFWPEDLVEQLTRLREEAGAALKKAAVHPAVGAARAAGEYSKFLASLRKRVAAAEAEAA
ncbi:hypothetical protein ACFC26_43670 [Kitasatospora purpeofusca]|uniref:hypothetical protein n=1 Tax=Kitasatospora purpeofusca TaxID=67352 RepID=UPI0035D5B8C3